MFSFFLHISTAPYRFLLIYIAVGLFFYPTVQNNHWLYTSCSNYARNEIHFDKNTTKKSNLILSSVLWALLYQDSTAT